MQRWEGAPSPRPVPAETGEAEGLLPLLCSQERTWRESQSHKIWFNYSLRIFCMYACSRAAPSYCSAIGFQTSISFLQMHPARVAQVLGEPT